MIIYTIFSFPRLGGELCIMFRLYAVICVGMSAAAVVPAPKKAAQVEYLHFMSDYLLLLFLMVLCSDL
jgi:hypothetical protein